MRHGFQVKPLNQNRIPDELQFGVKAVFFAMDFIHGPGEMFIKRLAGKTGGCTRNGTSKN